MTDLLPFLHQLSATARAVTRGARFPMPTTRRARAATIRSPSWTAPPSGRCGPQSRRRFPRTGSRARNMASSASEAPRRWLLDPIDGTRALICGLPSWTTLVALLEEGEPVAGLHRCAGAGRADDRPARRDHAQRRAGAGIDLHRARRRRGCRRPIRYLFSGAEAEAFDRVRRSVRLTRYGYDALAYARLGGGASRPGDREQAEAARLGGAGAGGARRRRGDRQLAGRQRLRAGMQSSRRRRRRLFEQAVELLSR